MSNFQQDTIASQKWINAPNGIATYETALRVYPHQELQIVWAEATSPDGKQLELEMVFKRPDWIADDPISGGPVRSVFGLGKARIDTSGVGAYIGPERGLWFRVTELSAPAAQSIISLIVQYRLQTVPALTAAQREEIEDLSWAANPSGSGILGGVTTR